MGTDQPTDPVGVEIIEGGIAVLTLDKPPANAMDPAFLSALCDRLDELAADQSVRALVLTGAGKVFCAGVDLKSVVDYDHAQQQAMVNGLNRMVHTIYGFRVPTVAAVNGHAIAGGLVLTLCCDARIGPEDTGLFGLAEVRAGVPFPYAPTEVVRAELSPGDARYIALFGGNMKPDEALRRGVFDELQPQDQVTSRAIERARELTKLPPQTFQTIKQQVRGPVLDRMAKVIADKSDPTLKKWLTDETRAAARVILEGGK
jgi:enoyl-CoA hydratase